MFNPLVACFTRLSLPSPPFPVPPEYNNTNNNFHLLLLFSLHILLVTIENRSILDSLNHISLWKRKSESWKALDCLKARVFVTIFCLLLYSSSQWPPYLCHPQTYSSSDSSWHLKSLCYYLSLRFSQRNPPDAVLCKCESYLTFSYTL